jgi:hypothetical protein
VIACGCRGRPVSPHTAHPQHNVSPLGELGCIGVQVEQHSPQPVGVTAHHLQEGSRGGGRQCVIKGVRESDDRVDTVRRDSVGVTRAGHMPTTHQLCTNTLALVYRLSSTPRSLSGSQHTTCRGKEGGRGFPTVCGE